MKRYLLFLVLSSLAWGQGAFIPPQQTLKIVNGVTSPVPLATVTVCAANASGIPCAPALVGAIFKDAALTQPLANPFTSDAFGNYQFAILPGTYTVTTTALGFVGNSFQITVSSGSSGGTPGGSNTQVQFNNLGAFAGVGITAGQTLVGTTGAPIAQTKPMVDVRDSATNFDCAGSNAMDTGMQSISSTAHIIVPVGCVIKLASAHTYPQTFEFKQGGQLAPTTGTLITLTGPIIAGSYQIFGNALATQGGINFQGNNNSFDVLPEWWGAVAGGSASTNTTAMQAALFGAFGCNTSPATSCRTNASGLAHYNKRLRLTGTYQINAQLTLYHVIGFTIDCGGNGRLASGLQQTTSNQKIFDGQSDAYGAFVGCSWSSTVSQDLSHPLIDLNFDSSQGSDLAPQQMDFYYNNWNGNSLAKIGVRIAAAGGGAQGSNINFYNNESLSFTEASYMVGAGSGGTPTQVATNAISMIWHGGDCQNDIAYCIEAFGLQQGKVDSTTFEDGSFPSFGGTAQTGYDIWVSNSPAGGVFEIDNVRSESIFLAAGTTPFIVRNSFTADQAFIPNNRSGTINAGDVIQGSGPGGHGVYYSVTGTGTINFLGTTTTPLTAASGTATSITDSVGGFTVNAWTGYQVSIVGTGAAANQYCVITSNTATTFTCTGGWLTDFNTVTIANPNNTSSYIVEPQWGTQFSSNGATWATISKTIFGSGGVDADWLFIPGLQLTLGGTGGNSNLRHVQVTRSDWMGSTIFDNVNSTQVFDGVIAAVPDAGPGAGAGSLGLALLQRSYKFTRNSLTELAQTTQHWFGTRTLHWGSGTSSGGTSVGDTYLGLQGTTAGQGALFVTNNSSGVPQKWTFNFDGSLTVPTGSGTAAHAVTGLFSTASNNLSFAVNSGNPLQLSTNDVQVSQRNLSFVLNTGQHINTQAANNDITGTVTVSASTSGAHNFTTGYTSAPSCQLTPQSDPTATGTYWVTTSTSAVTANVHTSGTISFTYTCIGNPN